jgi:hypothetical protein
VLADLDGDGRWEAMVLNSAGNLLVRPALGGAQVLDAAALGLPLASGDGMFLDVDGDGLLDFFSVPQGLSLGQPRGGFALDDRLDIAWAGHGGDVRFAWFDADADGDPDLWLLKLNGAQMPRPLRALYNRAPVAVQALIERGFGRAAVRQRYWLSTLYENRIGTGRRRTLPVTDGAGVSLPAGVPIEVTIREGSTDRREIHLTGETDSARLSQTRADIALTLPPGAEIVGFRPIDP